MLVPLLTLSSSLFTASPAAAALPATAADPPVRVSFNWNGDYAHGDRAKVYAKSADAGYLVVLQADGAGHVKVLFPLDPQDDQRIKGGKKYELKGRGGREAFVADDTKGHGIVLAAVSQSPFRFDQFTRDGRWNTQALSDQRLPNDPESGLLNLVERMKPAPEHFDYDVATYVVSDQYARGLYPYEYPYAWGYDPWWGYGHRFGFGPRFGFGLTYRPWHDRRGWGR
jgi:uncharacterized protein DUF4384